MKNYNIFFPGNWAGKSSTRPLERSVGVERKKKDIAIRNRIIHGTICRIFNFWGFDFCSWQEA
ncbi:hypothetical protein SDJN02_22501, partial [Cucurbita argyrosperma subsp. argyrosperma]